MFNIQDNQFLSLNEVKAYWPFHNNSTIIDMRRNYPFDHNIDPVKQKRFEYTMKFSENSDKFLPVSNSNTTNDKLYNFDNNLSKNELNCNEPSCSVSEKQNFNNSTPSGWPVDKNVDVSINSYPRKRNDNFVGNFNRTFQHSKGNVNQQQAQRRSRGGNYRKWTRQEKAIYSENKNYVGPSNIITQPHFRQHKLESYHPNFNRQNFQTTRFCVNNISPSYNNYTSNTENCEKTIYDVFQNKNCLETDDVMNTIKKENNIPSYSFEEKKSTLVTEVPSVVMVYIDVNKTFDTQVEEIIAQIQRTEGEKKLVNIVLGDVIEAFKHFPTFKNGFLFGSTVSETAMRNSDIDICLMFDEEATAKVLLKKYHKVMYKKQRFVKILKILNARVPIIRATHAVTNIQVDINASSNNGEFKSNFIRYICSSDKRVKDLIMLNLLWGKHHKIIGTTSFNSYSIMLLVIFYLQVGLATPILPPIYKILSSSPHFNDICLLQNYNTDTLSSLFVGFFKFYANFDFKNLVISIYAGEQIPCKAFLNSDCGVLPVCLKSDEILLKDREKGFIISDSNVQDPFDLMLNCFKHCKTDSINNFKNNCEAVIKICSANPLNYWLSNVLGIEMFKEWNCNIILDLKKISCANFDKICLAIKTILTDIFYFKVMEYNETICDTFPSLFNDMKFHILHNNTNDCVLILEDFRDIFNKKRSKCIKKVLDGQFLSSLFEIEQQISNILIQNVEKQNFRSFLDIKLIDDSHIKISFINLFEGKKNNFKIVTRLLRNYLNSKFINMSLTYNENPKKTLTETARNCIRKNLQWIINKEEESRVIKNINDNNETESEFGKGNQIDSVNKLEKVDKFDNTYNVEEILKREKADNIESEDKVEKILKLEKVDTIESEDKVENVVKFDSDEELERELQNTDERRSSEKLNNGENSKNVDELKMKVKPITTNDEKDNIKKIENNISESSIITEKSKAKQPSMKVDNANKAYVDNNTVVRTDDLCFNCKLKINNKIHESFQLAVEAIIQIFDRVFLIVLVSKIHISADLVKLNFYSLKTPMTKLRKEYNHKCQCSNYFIHEEQITNMMVKDIVNLSHSINLSCEVELQNLNKNYLQFNCYKNSNMTICDFNFFCKVFKSNLQPLLTSYLDLKDKGNNKLL